MQAKRTLLVFATSAALLLGCSVSSFGLPASQPTPTAIIVPADTAVPAVTYTTVPPTPTVPTAPTEPLATFTPVPTAGSTQQSFNGMPVSYQNLALVIPDGLSNGSTNTTNTDVEFPYINPSNGEMPQHVRMVLNGYAVQGTILDPQIELYDAAQYGQYSEMTNAIIATLRSAQYLDGQPLPSAFPQAVYHAHVQSINFANGHGIRYLAQYDDAPLPANNKELIYYYHGLTNDGKYYVQVILPTTASFLSPDARIDSPLPAGGIPFPMQDWGPYFQAIGDKLNATPPDQFSPALTTLDALVQSITVK